MSSYYEILSISPTASANEIEAAIESRYHQVRRLTTHHDADIVNQANQALLILEQARAILLDPLKRTQYDTSLGYSAGGLADPNLSSNTQSVPNNTTNVSQIIGIQSQANKPNYPNVHVWICPQCQRPSSPGTLYCQNCRQVLGRICPNCQTTYEAKANFCPSCGQNFETATKRAELVATLGQKQTQRYTLASQINLTSTPEIQLLDYLSTGGTGWAAFMGLVTIHYILSTIVRLIFTLLDDQTVSQASSILNAFSTINALLRWIIWFSVIAAILYLIIKKNVKMNIPAIVGYGFLSLLALAFSGPNFSSQIRYAEGNAWLVFPALIASGLVGGGWGLLHRYNLSISQQSLQLVIPSSFQPYLNRLLNFYQKSPKAMFALGLGFSLFTLIFSGSRTIISVLAAVSSIGACIVVLGIALQARILIDTARTDFLFAQETAKNNLAQLDAEIAKVEQQIKDIG